MMSADAVVVGGGPAGSAAAIRLARGGARVILLEKTYGPHHKVCGEFVSAAARQHLLELGVDRSLLEAFPINTVRLLHDAQIAESKLPFGACSLSRKHLDEALLRIAAEEGVDIRQGCRVRGIAASSGVRVTTGDDGSIAAAAAFLATGKHDLRGLPRGRGIQKGSIGLKMHLDLPPAATRMLEGAVELLFFEGGYAGLQLVECRRANLCLLIGKTQFEKAGRCWPALVDGIIQASPHWRVRLSGARPCWERPLAIYNLPYGYVADQRAGPVFRVGDQLAVVPPFAGDGMAVALSSGREAADSFLPAGPDAAAYHARMADRFGSRLRASAWGSRLLEWPLLQSAAVGIAAHAPGLLAWAAGATRISRAASAA